jgi:hypothetical protein
VLEALRLVNFGAFSSPSVFSRGVVDVSAQESSLAFYSMIKFLLICPTSALEKIFNPQNILYIPPVKNCFRLEFEQIP